MRDNTDPGFWAKLAAVVIALIIGGTIAYGAETIRARIWSHEIRNVGCTCPPPGE